MDEVKDLLLLSILSGKEGDYESAAKFFSETLTNDGLDQFVNEVIRPAPISRRISGRIDDTNNSISPGLSSSASADDLVTIANRVERVMRSESSLVDEDDQETIARTAIEEEDEYGEEDDSDVLSSDDDPCWEGYEQFGTKIKDGKEVPNCVKIKDDESDSSSDEDDNDDEDDDDDYISESASVGPVRLRE